MIDTVKKAYKAFGYTMRSEIDFPELSEVCDLDNRTDDIDVEIADLSELSNELAMQQKKFIAKERFLTFQVADTATFSVQEGDKIIVSPMKESDVDKIRLFILGTCMAALLMQRKILPLHGSAIAIDGKAYAIIGDSGAGKSTLASALISRGYQLLSDDVIAVSFLHETDPWVKPSYPQQKLWQESLKQLGMEENQYRPLFQREKKFAVPVTSAYIAEPLPLAGVFELVKTENDQIEIHQIQKLERMNTLFRHTFRNFLLSHFGLLEWHFHLTASRLSQIGLYRLHRPTSGFTAQQLAALILRTLHKEE